MKALGKFLKKHEHSFGKYGLEDKNDAEKWIQEEPEHEGHDDSEETEENKRRLLRERT